ncbi:MAG: STAS domain-containing protein [Xanthomonadaceae bacterium]|nr:STAS domain-containing protein [Xanthomonadaceae bacterium]
MAQTDNGPFRLEGRLTVDEVPGVYHEHLEWKDEGLPATIDLSGLQATDSSTVALLLEWLSWARRAGQALKLENPPDALLTIAGLSQVNDILGWENAE